jgi:hypothetical protein
VTAAADLEVVAGNVERFPEQAVRGVVTGLRAAILTQTRRDTGGDLRLSGNRSRERLDVTTTVNGDRVVVGEVIPGPRRQLGPWRWLNDGTRPRAQGSGHHPGTRPKRTIDAAVNRAGPGPRA